MRLRSVVWTDPRRIFESLPLKTEDGAVVLLTHHTLVGRLAAPPNPVLTDGDAARRRHTQHDPRWCARGGVIRRYAPLAALVFFASVALPMLKLVGLTVMLVATQTGRAGWLSLSPDPAMPMPCGGSGAGRRLTCSWRRYLAH